jgi:hypothetical protein
MQHFILRARNLADFFTNFDAVFRELHTIRTLTPLYFKINFSTVTVVSNSLAGNILGGMMVIVLAIGPVVRGFKPGRE